MREYFEKQKDESNKRLLALALLALIGNVLNYSSLMLLNTLLDNAQQ